MGTRIRKNMKLYLYLAGVMLVSAQRGESTLLNTSDRVLGSAQDVRNKLMLKWIFISIGILLFTSLGAVYFHYRNKHAKNPLDVLKKGLGNGTIDRAQYFDVQGQLNEHKENMEASGKFYNADGHAIDVQGSIKEEDEASEMGETITETDHSAVPNEGMWGGAGAINICCAGTTI